MVHIYCQKTFIFLTKKIFNNILSTSTTSHNTQTKILYYMYRYLPPPYLFPTPKQNCWVPHCKVEKTGTGNLNFFVSRPVICDVIVTFTYPVTELTCATYKDSLINLLLPLSGATSCKMLRQVGIMCGYD